MAEAAANGVMRDDQGLSHHHRGWWWKTLLAGLVIWVTTVVVTSMTQNLNLVPALILVGSFLVPLCVVLFVIERVTGSISTLQLILAFFVGGISGVLGASLLETSLPNSIWSYGLVGVIEEFVKGSILVVIGWRTLPKTARQGALLGATVGAGFAAFESAGYAFNAAITAQGIDLPSLLQTEVIRALMAPVGHVAWTALLGAVLFGVAHGRRRYRWSLWIPVAYLGAAALHAVWDATGTLAVMIAVLATGTTIAQAETGYLFGTTAQSVQSLATILYVIGLAIVTGAGTGALLLVVTHYRRVAKRQALLGDTDQFREDPAAVGV